MTKDPIREILEKYIHLERIDNVDYDDDKFEREEKELIDQALKEIQEIQDKEILAMKIESNFEHTVSEAEIQKKIPSVEKIEQTIEKYAKNVVTDYEIRTIDGKPEQRTFHSPSEIKTGMLAQAIHNLLTERIK